MDRQEITQILSRAGLRPQHKFGQNFMVDQNTLRALADAGQIQATDIILEVGPGVGNLTRQLATRAPQGHVLAVDIDKKLLPAAQRHHAALKNITWLNADVLAGKHEINPEVINLLRQLKAAHPRSGLKLIANLPYNAASPIIAELLVLMGNELSTRPSFHAARNAGSAALCFSRFAFTVQWEVAERMRAEPDTSDYGPLGILINLMADVEVIRKIAPGVFWPPPKVHSALVTITPCREKIARIQNPVALQKLLSGVFSHRRQTLHNALKHYLAEGYSSTLVAQIAGQNIDLKLRPENITPPQYLGLAELVSAAYHLKDLPAAQGPMRRKSKIEN